MLLPLIAAVFPQPPSRVRSAMIAALLAGLATLNGLPATAGEVEAVRLGAKVTALRQAGEAVYVRAGAWLRLSLCASAPVCTTRASPPRLRSAADGIPHGRIATAPGRGIIRAWYTEPTTRYDHGVLGDRVEGGALAVTGDDGSRHNLRLDDRHVFEDLTPRIVDLDGDGRNEVVTIRSDTRAGAVIAVYGLVGGALVERAAIDPIGLTHRWLNMAGIADYSGDGRPDIAIVKTPHIGGRFELWTLRGDQLERLARANGFSNHAIGSTDLDLSATADVNGDGVADLALPDARRGALRVLSLAGGGVTDLARIDLPARVATGIGVLAGEAGPVFVIGLADGSLALVRP